MAEAGEREAAGLGNLAISAETTSALTTTLGLVQQLKSAIYDIAQSPLLAPYAALRLQTELAKISAKVREFWMETNKANDMMGKLGKTLADSRTWTAVGAFLASTGLKMQNMRAEISKLNVDFYKVTAAAGEKGFGMALDLTNKRLDAQLKYGKEVGDMYVKQAEALKRRLDIETQLRGQALAGHPVSPMNEEQTDQFIRNISALSRVTGVDYAKAINVLMDSFSHMNLGAVEAGSEIDLLRDQFEKGETSIGNMNDNMELSLEIMKDLASKGATYAAAFAGQNGIQKIASAMHLTTNATRELYQSMSNLSGLGEEGVNARLELLKSVAISHGYTPKQKEMLNAPEYAGLSETAKFQKMALMHPEQMVKFENEMIRSVVKKDINYVQPGGLSNRFFEPAEQIRIGAALPGISMERIKAAVMEPMNNAKAQTEGQSIVDINNRSKALTGPLAAISPTTADLDKSLKDTVTVLEELKTELEKLNANLGGASPLVSGGLEVAGGLLSGAGLIKGMKWGGKLVQKILSKGAKVGEGVIAEGENVVAKVTAPIYESTSTAGTAIKEVETASKLGKLGKGLRGLLGTGVPTAVGVGGGFALSEMAMQKDVLPTTPELQAKSDAYTKVRNDVLLALMSIFSSGGNSPAINLNIDGQLLTKIIIDTQNLSGTTKSNQ